MRAFRAGVRYVMAGSGFAPGFLRVIGVSALVCDFFPFSGGFSGF